MSGYRVWIPGPLPGMNEIIKAAKGCNGKGLGYSAMKKRWTGDIALRIRAARVPPMQRAHVRFDWVSVDRCRDPDNIEAAQKFAWDALKHKVAKVLTNDGWKQHGGSEHHHELGAKAGVWLTVTEVEQPTP